MNNIRILINNEEEVKEICKILDENIHNFHPNAHHFCYVDLNLTWCKTGCESCNAKEACDKAPLPEIPAKDFIKKHTEKQVEDDAFYDPNYTQEEFKVGDEVYIKGIVQDIHEDGDLQVEYKDCDDDVESYYFRKDQLYKAKDINEQADQQTIENVKSHLEEFETKELDNDFMDALNELSQKKHSSSVMMGNKDLSEIRHIDDIDDDDDMYGRTE